MRAFVLAFATKNTTMRDMDTTRQHQTGGATRGEASRKQAVLARHMSWPRSSLQIEEYTP